MEGKRITTLEELQALSRDRRSVVVPGFIGFKKPRPATFVLNQQGQQLLRMFQSGMFIYEGAKRPIKGESK